MSIGLLFFSQFNPWCQMVMGKVNPADLIEWVGANFSHVYVVHKTPDRSFVLEHVENANCLKILEDVLRNGWLVIDLLVTNAEERLSPATTGQSAVRPPQVVHDERDASKQRIAASMRASMSRRLTAPQPGFASRYPRFVLDVMAFIERRLGRDAALLARNISRVATLRPVIRRTPASRGSRPFRARAWSVPHTRMPSRNGCAVWFVRRS